MTSKNLKRARELKVPKRDLVLKRDYSVKKFWQENNEVLSAAWKEWEETESQRINTPIAELIHTKLRDRVEAAWQVPDKEYLLKELLKEVSPGVYQFQFFNTEKVKELRDYLDRVDKAQIPLRPPYGIVLNRKGIMLDQRSEGHLSAPSFQSLYQEMLDKYMRPIARLLFPEVIDYDRQTFGFSIQYKPEKDTSIRMHTDASSVTLNVNINLPEESYSGSEVSFHDPSTGNINKARFEPGTAIIHRGNTAHAAHPITSGTRTNLVLWLYGEQMQVPTTNTDKKRSSPQKRWSKPSTLDDNSAPF